MRAEERRYTYLGDRMTDPALRGKPCAAVLRADGKCITGTRASMLVLFDGESYPRVVQKRMLRKRATPTRPEEGAER